jgi:acetolactate synthase-1/2/3 large subunit
MREALRGSSIAVATTWNGMDRVDSDEPNYIGRPDTWGQRSANVLIQQADLLVAVGTRLGLQQTGFNWQAFAPLARVIHVEIDAAELQKGHPRIDLAVNGDADDFLPMYLSADLGKHDPWLAFCRRIRRLLPLNEANRTAPGFVNPYDLTQYVGAMCGPTDIIVPCSSGSAFTVPMQVFPQRFGQRIVTAKGLASMGVGLSCALGAALAFPNERTVLFEGDGGFSQNLQELATLGVNDLNVKIFIMSNAGYASIRANQKTYFNGEYLGCDRASGLGFPDWPALFAAYGIPVQTVTPQSLTTGELDARFRAKGPAAFIVHVDPDQTYFPKITSRINAEGGMESMPLHLMSPDLPADLAAAVMPYLNAMPKPSR